MTVFQKEMQDFQNIPVEKRASSTLPKLFIEKEITRDSFTVGKMIVVKSIEEVTSLETSVIAESISLPPEMPKVTK